MIDLYMWGTGNGLRASLVLAETGLAHRVHKVDLTKGEQRSPEFLRLNPVGAIPVIVDQDGPGGRPLTLTQSRITSYNVCYTKLLRGYGRGAPEERRGARARVGATRQVSSYQPEF